MTVRRVVFASGFIDETTALRAAWIVVLWLSAEMILSLAGTTDRALLRLRLTAV